MSTPKAHTRQQLRQILKCQRRYDRLRLKLARTGYLALGTITQSRLTCGTPTCRCHKGPRYRHGPYSYWTTKIKGRSVSKLLRPQEAKLYLEWIAHRRALDQTVQDMLEVSRVVAALVLTVEDPFIPRS